MSWFHSALEQRSAHSSQAVLQAGDQMLQETHLEHQGILVGCACVQQLPQGLAPAQPAPPRSLHTH